jgi:hypothetical protein
MRTARWTLAAMASLALCAHGADVPGVPDVVQGVHWHCWYTGQLENPGIACRLTEPEEPVTPQALDSAMLQLPQIVRRIRTDPESLRDNVVVIPLHAPPIDMRMAMRLANSVMCGRRVGCTVELSPQPGG